MTLTISPYSDVVDSPAAISFLVPSSDSRWAPSASSGAPWAAVTVPRRQLSTHRRHPRGHPRADPRRRQPGTHRHWLCCASASFPAPSASLAIWSVPSRAVGQPPGPSLRSAEAGVRASLAPARRVSTPARDELGDADRVEPRRVPRRPSCARAPTDQSLAVRLAASSPPAQRSTATRVCLDARCDPADKRWDPDVLPGKSTPSRIPQLPRSDAVGGIPAKTAQRGAGPEGERPYR